MSKILSATTELFEYSIKAQPNPTAILVPIRDSITASIMKGNLMYVDEAPISLIIFISFFLEYAASLNALIINIKAAKPMSNAKAQAEITSVSVRLRSLSIASPDERISFTAGFPSNLSVISS